MNDQTVSEARLGSILATAVDGIIVIDDKMNVLVFNAACERLFGYYATEVIGRNVKVLMPEGYASQHDDYVRNYMRTGEKKIIGIGREVSARHKDGTVIPIELSVGEAATTPGRQFVGILRDLRPRKAVERRVSQLQAQLVHLARVSAMDEMGAAIAHELNQPLTAVMLYLQAAERSLKKLNGDSPHDPAIANLLQKGLREADRASSIIQRMRNFVERREPERRWIDIVNLIDDSVDLTLLGANANTVRVRRRYEESLPDVEADPVQIQQILVNVLRNAVEASRGAREPWLAVSTAFTGSSVTVSVEDSGPGIPSEVMPTLFKAFSTGKRTGMGLGLAISRTIAQNHGGDLTVDPGGNGRGATFILTLPAKADAPRRAD
ncbi:MAG: PAS domain S-box protein [Hyphomicrobiaceae bacterium]|nr:PAS domain S-box protein [Hyphomicrobiaceae bacterium]